MQYAVYTRKTNLEHERMKITLILIRILIDSPDCFLVQCKKYSVLEVFGISTTLSNGILIIGIRLYNQCPASYFQKINSCYSHVHKVLKHNFNSWNQFYSRFPTCFYAYYILRTSQNIMCPSDNVKIFDKTDTRSPDLGSLLRC